MQMIMYRLITCLFISLTLSSCSASKTVYTQPVNVTPANSPISKKLYQHYSEWQGVRYREGGMSKSGIDCSGFVHIAYKNKLQKPIPRSTELLSQSGRTVTLQQLRTGDLVFFKTGWKTRHVGIYMGNGQFMHASSSRGVMMSKLSNPYWSDAYWMARRY